LGRSGDNRSVSWVANVMVSVSLEDERECAALDRWLQHELPARPGEVFVDHRGRVVAEPKGVGALNELTGRDTRWAGPKFPECTVWAGTLNHGDVDALVARVAATPWTVPAAVQLLIMDQEQSYFRLWMIRDGEIRQYAPAPPPDDSAW
jgi:hypothetical protein